MAAHDHSLIHNARSLWDKATRSPFLDALAAGTMGDHSLRQPDRS
jgi:thiaminase